MQLRLALPQDAEAIRRIYNKEVTGSTVTFDLVPRTARAQQAWMARHRGAYPALVAVQGHDVCGFASLSPFHERAAYSTTAEDSVYVEEDYRGKGLGGALLAELVAIAVSQGFHTVIARTTADNEGSIALHKACGFDLVGIEREVGRKFGRWLDVAILQKML